MSGDNLSKIAKQFYGDANKYPLIFEANKPMLSHPDKFIRGRCCAFRLLVAWGPRATFSQASPRFGAVCPISRLLSAVFAPFANAGAAVAWPPFVLGCERSPRALFFFFRRRPSHVSPAPRCCLALGSPDRERPQDSVTSHPSVDAERGRGRTAPPLRRIIDEAKFSGTIASNDVREAPSSRWINE